MSKDQRFDQAIIEQASKAVAELLLHKEVRGIAIAIDWNLPNAAAASMPIGLAKSSDDTLDSMMLLHTQIVRLAGTTGHGTIEHLKEIYTNVMAAEAKLKEGQHVEDKSV